MKAPGCNDASRTAPTNAARRTIAANWIRSDLRDSPNHFRQRADHAASQKIRRATCSPRFASGAGTSTRSSRRLSTARLRRSCARSHCRDDIPSSSGPMPASASTQLDQRLSGGVRYPTSLLEPAPPFPDRSQHAPGISYGDHRRESAPERSQRHHGVGDAPADSLLSQTLRSLSGSPSHRAVFHEPAAHRPNAFGGLATPLAPRAVKAPGLAHSKRPGCAVQGELSRQALPSASDFPASQSIREVHVRLDGRANRGVFAPAA